ncbi:RNA-binding domain-containing protein [Candidatus Poriferisocius sp.]|uniref:RNA-binding domain-containing protein n=1 Tax=Candidatus Poriferisocius sp. TaxID=3101276 RepID=UPI003B01E37B
MTPLRDDELLRLLDTGETDRVEYKESLAGSAPERIREAICAFANDLPDHGVPGIVFVGARDDGSLTGLEVTDDLLRQLADMKTDGNIVPPPSMTVRKVALLGTDIAVITVMPSDSPPVRYRGAIHVRTGPRRDLATAQDERILSEKRRSADAPFDVQRVPSAVLSDLDQNYFENEYLPQAFAREVLEANDRSREEQMAATKMIASAEDPTPTVLGLLVLGKNPQDFLPGAYIQFIRFAGTEPHDDIIDNADIRGTVADMLRGLEEKLKAHNRIAIDLFTDFTERRISLYPLGALQQIARNAVMHRTYEATNAPVHVRWFRDRIEVISPGGPFGQVATAGLGKPGVVDYRNPNLAEALRTLGFVQRFGIGISNAQKLLREAGHPEAIFNGEHDRVLATIPEIHSPEGGLR